MVVEEGELYLGFSLRSVKPPYRLAHRRVPGRVCGGGFVDRNWTEARAFQHDLEPSNHRLDLGRDREHEFADGGLLPLLENGGWASGRTQQPAGNVGGRLRVTLVPNELARSFEPLCGRERIIGRAVPWRHVKGVGGEWLEILGDPHGPWPAIQCRVAERVRPAFAREEKAPRFRVLLLDHHGERDLVHVRPSRG